MAVIDADTHVDECEATWQYMPPSEVRFRPATLAPAEELGSGVTAPGYNNRYWMIDGKLQLRRVRDDVRTGTTVQSRELHDVATRLRHMDELRVDVHVIYPTLFLGYLTSNPAMQAALCRTYNRWLADRCSTSGGRLRWVALVPMLDLDAAIEELQWAKQNGACGVFKLATEIDRRVIDPYFFPLYEAAQDLDLPICIHTGSGDPGLRSLTPSDSLPTNMLDAFYGVVFYGLPARFPTLRFGFIEAGASWIPYVLDRLRARQERMAWAYTFDIAEDLFRTSRLFVTCQTVEDLPYLLRFGTEDNLLVGTDYTHADASAEIQTIDIMRRWGDEGKIDPTVVRKVLEDNPKVFYGL